MSEVCKSLSLALMQRISLAATECWVSHAWCCCTCWGAADKEDRHLLMFWGHLSSMVVEDKFCRVLKPEWFIEGPDLGEVYKTSWEIISILKVRVYCARILILTQWVELEHQKLVGWILWNNTLQCSIQCQGGLKNGNPGELNEKEQTQGNSEIMVIFQNGLHFSLCTKNFLLPQHKGKVSSIHLPHSLRFFWLLRHLLDLESICRSFLECSGKLLFSHTFSEVGVQSKDIFRVMWDSCLLSLFITVLLCYFIISFYF